MLERIGSSCLRSRGSCQQTSPFEAPWHLSMQVCGKGVHSGSHVVPEMHRPVPPVMREPRSAMVDRRVPLSSTSRCSATGRFAMASRAGHRALSAPVGVVDAVQRGHYPSCQASRHDSGAGSSIRLAFAPHPRANDEIMCAGTDRRDEHVREEVDAIGTVAVAEQDDGAAFAGRCNAGGTDAPVASLGQRH